MAASSHRFQPPKGTRDFYPADLAVRRHMERVWREVSTAFGFDEVDGPTFEHLDLYTVKSGEGIVSELFSFRRAGGDVDYALRPEFTPTLARMVATRAAQLAKPTKWFCMPSFFRAERPQRGRLREFYQWNVDLIGDDSPAADAEIVAVTVAVLERFGIQSKDVTVHISNREVVAEAIRSAGVDEDKVEAVMVLLDKKVKLDDDTFARECATLGFDHEAYDAATTRVANVVNDAILAKEKGLGRPVVETMPPAVESMLALVDELHACGVLHWCEVDFSIVRGLAYYTGAVFEVHDGAERAIAGGGRYDKLVELFGGPPTPAVGIAMGDVVIRLILEDKGLLEAPEHYLPRPDVFVISTGAEDAETQLRPTVAALRRAGLHARHTYRATRNVGKLLGEANKLRARFAAILGDELGAGNVTLKDLDAGTERTVALKDLPLAVAGMPDLNEAFDGILEHAEDVDRALDEIQATLSRSAEQFEAEHRSLKSNE